MPIITERITAGIYHQRWQGHVTADEVLASLENEKRLCKDDNCARYIIILDGSELRTIPFNIAKLSKAFSGNEIATLAYKGPAVAQKLAEIVGSMVHIPFEFYDDWDETLARAKQLMLEHHAVIFNIKSP